MRSIPLIFAGIVVVIFIGIFVFNFRDIQETEPLYVENEESEQFPLPIMDVTAPNGTIRSFVVDRDDLRQKGLGGRDGLEDDEGMIFIFPEPGPYGFWMKDMHFAIDMIWIDNEKKVAGILSDISPDSYPDIFVPPRPIVYVLELTAGGAEKFGIATGTQLVF